MISTWMHETAFRPNRRNRPISLKEYIMTQVTIAKPAAKNAKAVAKNSPAKKASAAAPRTVRKAKAVAPVKAVAFYIEDYARPKAGAPLFAFTAAWLTLTGLASGKAAIRADLVKIAGETAVTYHTKNGNFEKTDKGLIMTEKGNAFFAARTVDPQLFAAYETVMTTGEDGDKAGIKNPAAIKKAA